MSVLEQLLLADAAARAWLTTHHTPWLDAVMYAASVTGRAGAVWLAVGLVAMRLRRPRLAGQFWQLVLAIFLTLGFVDLVLKPTIGRSRPFDAIEDVRVVGARPASLSFPSGHAASAFAGAFVTTMMVRRGRWVLWALAVLIASSRIYIGVHYPIDVIAGAFVGLAVAVLVTGGRAWYSLGSSVASPAVPR
jgi:undecaprenyl-diphosphatase